MLVFYFVVCLTLDRHVTLMKAISSSLEIIASQSPKAPIEMTCCNPRETSTQGYLCGYVKLYLRQLECGPPPVHTALCESFPCGHRRQLESNVFRPLTAEPTSDTVSLASMIPLYWLSLAVRIWYALPKRIWYNWDTVWYSLSAPVDRRHS